MSVSTFLVRNIANVPAMIAHEFKCVPEDGSLVAILLNDAGEMIVTVRTGRLDGDGLLLDTAGRAGARVALLVGYGCTDDVEDRQISMARAMREKGLRVLAMLMVDGQQWQDRVSGAGGVIEPMELMRIGDEGVDTERPPMVSRTQQDVQARVRPVPGAMREPGDAEQGKELLMALGAGIQDQWSDAEVASMGAALQDHLFRDVMAAGWLLQPDNTAQERARAVEALLGLAVRVDGPLACEPLVLLALAAWCDRQVILAGAALDRLLSIDPQHRLGFLVRELMTLGPASMLFQ